MVASIPDARAVLEATKPEDSDYWKKRDRAKRAKEKIDQTIEEDSFDSKVSMIWSQEAKAMIAKAPSGIIEMAINNVEDFARDNGIDAINEDVVIDQMNSVGMDPNMLS